ncbi:TetR family transcriptional regulator C-terminal domain-containing protein [Roseovarius aquimarinus]|uniref:TetR family transcriptional regulator C-terminal domain-containing protein n=1 Tax=Roseovarius aquimarinus TaxID=1229156 RepID=A0ABW7I5S9_9RHOB
MTDQPSPKPRKERKENADRRRQQLLDATWRSIAENGLARTTLATVAAQAGLSQGVAVFYFKSKAGLLTEALRDHYARYQATWERALAEAGDDPRARLIALIRADFDPEICNPEALSIWFAFWGEQKFTPDYAAISAQFDIARNEAIREACAALMQGADEGDITRTAEWIDTFSDGYWQRLHVLPGSYSAKDCLAETLRMVERLVPQISEAAAEARRAL